MSIVAGFLFGVLAGLVWLLVSTEIVTLRSAQSKFIWCIHESTPRDVCLQRFLLPKED